MLAMMMLFESLMGMTGLPFKGFGFRVCRVPEFEGFRESIYRDSSLQKTRFQIQC